MADATAMEGEVGDVAVEGVVVAVAIELELEAFVSEDA